MKRLRFLALAVAVCVFAGLFAGCSAVNGDQILSVDGEKIYKDEFVWYLTVVQNNMLQSAGVASAEEAQAFWSTTEIEGKNAADVAKERAVENAVVTKLLCRKAEEMGISLTEEEKADIQTQVGSEITEIGGRAEYEKRLAEIGSTSDGYIKFIETMQLASKVSNAVMALPEYEVSDEEARESVKNTYITAKHILLTTMDENGAPYQDQAQIDAVKAQIDDLYKQIKDGADFDKLMNEYCQDPGLATAPNGYTFGKGQMVPEFETAAYALEVGEVSEPVATSYGYHIIKRVETQITDEEIEQYAAQEKQILQYSKLDEVYEQWKNEAKIKVNDKNLAAVVVK